MSGGLATADTVQAGATDTIRYTIEPLYPGLRPLNITGHLYRMGDEMLLDTTVTVALNVSGASTQPLISASAKLDLSNCSTSIVPVILHAPCDSTTIKQCIITAPNGENYTLNLSFPRTLQTGEFDTLNIAFPPQGLNTTSTVYTRIKGTYGGTTASFDTTTQTQVTFVCASGSVTENPAGPALVLIGLQATSNQLKFDLENNDPNFNECHAEILSILGEVVAQKTLLITSTHNEEAWDLNGLSSGAYYLRLTSGEDHITSRFVLVR